MSVDSRTEKQGAGKLASLQDTLESEQVAFVDTLDEEITTVIEQASTLQRYDYVIGTVDDVWISSNDHRHFELVRYNAETDTVDQIHCVIFSSRRSAITTPLTEGRQVAVAGQLSFYPPQGSGSILVDKVVSVDGDEDDPHPFEIIRANRRVQIAIATGLLLAALAVVVLLVL